MEIIISNCHAAIDFFIQNQHMIFIVVLAVFLGFEVIAHVPSLLHTPLMSGSNALSGITIIGGIIVLGSATTDDILAIILGLFAVILGTYNVVGGFVVSDRMLEMFKKKK